MRLTRCWTGRRWVEIGGLSLGFGPRGFLERIWWGGRLRYAWSPVGGLMPVPKAD